MTGQERFIESVSECLVKGIPITRALAAWIGDSPEGEEEARLSKSLNKIYCGAVYFLGDIVKIFTVNGQFARNPDGGGVIDFTMGGNWYAGDPPGIYRPICGEDEIVLHDLLSRVDFMATAIHELTERHVMKYEGLKYDKAHDEWASPVEIVARRVLEAA